MRGVKAKRIRRTARQFAVGQPERLYETRGGNLRTLYLSAACGRYLAQGLKKSLRA